MFNPNLTDFSSGPFKPEAFLPQNVDPKIVSSSKDFTAEEKIRLGQHVSKLVKGSREDLSALGSKILLSPSTDDDHIKLAETYIKLAHSRRVEILKQGLSEARKGLPEEGQLSESLASSIEKLNNLEAEASQTDIKEAINGGLSALLELEAAERTPKNVVQAPTETRTVAIFKALISHGAVTHSDIENAKNTTIQAQKHLIATLFDVRVIPEIANEGYVIEGKAYTHDELETILKANNAEKRELIEAEVTFENATKILSQAKTYPLMQMAVTKIRENLESWDNLSLEEDSEGVEATQQQLGQQLENLVVLSDLIAKETSHPEDSHTFSLFSNSMEQADETNTFDAYLAGDRSLLGLDQQEQAVDMIRTSIERLKEDQKTADTNQSSPIPYLKTSIQGGAELQKAMRDGKAWAASQSGLIPQGTSANSVFRLQHPIDALKTAAYFKQNEGTRAAQKESAGYMERIIYDISEIMGLSDRFVPTGQTALRIAPSPNTINSGMKVWQEGELQKIEGAQTKFSGGIQVAVPGRILGDELKAGTADEITQEEVAKGVLASIVFGMFDAHVANILILTEGKVETQAGEIVDVVLQSDGCIVNKDGEIVTDIKNTVSTEKKILFFDNTRSLPNSNGFINRGASGIKSSYRCALLELEQTHEPLDAATIENLKKNVSEYKQNIQNLEKYIDDPISGFQARLEKVLSGWMNIQESMAALKQRVDLMQQSLATAIPDEFTLCDLAEQANPSYRFAYMLTILKKVPDMTAESFESLMIYHTHSTPEVRATINFLANKGYDVALIKEWCDDPALTLEEVLEMVTEHQQKILTQTVDPVEHQARIQKAGALRREIFNHAAVDYKDQINSVATLNATSLQKQPIRFYNFEKTFSVEENLAGIIAERIKDNQSHIQLLDVGDGKCIAIYGTPVGPCKKEVDFGIQLDKVKVDNTELSIDDFVRDYSAKKTVTHNDLLALSEEAVEAILENVPPDTVLLRKSSDGNSVVASIQIETSNGPEFYHSRFQLAPGSEEKFLLEGTDQLFTLEEIVEKKQTLKNVALNIEAFLQEGGEYHQLSRSIEEGLTRYMKEVSKSGVYLFKVSKQDYRIAYNTPTGPLAKKVNLQMAFNEIEIDGQKLDMETLVKKYSQCEEFPTYDMLPNLSFDQACDALEIAPTGTVLLSKSESRPGGLAITIAFGIEAVKNIVLIPSEEKGPSGESKFVYGSENLTMQEAVDKRLREIFVSQYPEKKTIPSIGKIPRFSVTRVDQLLRGQPIGSMLLARTENKTTFFLKVLTSSGTIKTTYFKQNPDSDTFTEAGKQVSLTVPQIIEHYRG